MKPYFRRYYHPPFVPVAGSTVYEKPFDGWMDASPIDSAPVSSAAAAGQPSSPDKRPSFHADDESHTEETEVDVSLCVETREMPGRHTLDETKHPVNELGVN